MSYAIAQLQDWARRLARFRICHAIGGHANDADTLQVCYRYGSHDELQHFFETLQCPLTHYASQPEQPVAGRSYPVQEYARMPSLIPGTRWTKQPGHCVIAGERVHAWCAAGEITLSVGAGYTITEADVESAMRVEPALAPLDAMRKDPPVDNPRCLCPKYHPEYFGARA